ncbi:MAG TPA: LpxL/LpxP family Kdo(2)-lipid IV(A) lauroyl/palmitoleoyl acyltransferase [Nitrospiraceae bacterium]|nr:LpxL/LpxP family Kdo(2)-lipid IV(A) lauroyl/palmitoleoyl acyltransferase [Nitrospiraceae bacterium]
MKKKQKRKRPANLYHPLYWPSWIATGCMRVLAYVPYRWQWVLGRWAGFLLRFMHRKRRETVEINLAACFPELSDQDRSLLAERCFESLGMALCETSTAWWVSDPRTRYAYRIVGLNHIRAALQKGRGVLLCSAHLHTAELAGRFMALEQPVTIVFRPQNDRVIEAVAHRRRAAYYPNMIHYRDMRGVVRALRRNEVVWYAPDIDAGTKRSVFVPFFGVPAASLTATARLARLTGAPVVPCFYFRRTDRTGYDIQVEPALERYPSGDLTADTARINQLIEAAVRRYPEQYLWQHRRFKSRPAGVTPLYGERVQRR